MIKIFKCSETKKIWDGMTSKKLPLDIQQGARRKLRVLNNAQSLNDLKIPPANRLEQLKGDRSQGDGVYVSMINGESDYQRYSAPFQSPPDAAIRRLSSAKLRKSSTAFSLEKSPIGSLPETAV